MRKFVARLTRREGGMTALQVVLLMGGCFVVAWALIEIWNGTSDPLEETTRTTVMGERGAIVAQTPTAPSSQRASAPARTSAPPRVNIPTRVIDPKSRSLGDLLLQLFTPEFNGGFHSPEALQEIDDRVSGNPLLWALSPVIIPEVRIQQIKYQKTLKDKLLTIADGLFNQMDLIPSKKATTTILHVADEAAQAGAKKLKGVMTRAEFEALEMTGKTQQQMRKELFELMKKHPDQVRRGTGRNGGEIWTIDLGDGTHGGIRLDPGELDYTKPDRMLGDIPHGHKEIVTDRGARRHPTEAKYKPRDVRERIGEPTGAKPRAPKNQDDQNFLDALKNHPPMPNRGRFKWDPESGKFVDEVQEAIRDFEADQKRRRGGPRPFAAPLTSPSIPMQGLRKQTTTLLLQLDEATFKLGRLIPGWGKQ